jgi:phage FluMu protein Com
MEISFNCPFCNQALTIDESGAGAEIGCPKCGEVLIIPPPEPAAGGAAEPEPRGHTVALPPPTRVEAQIHKASKPLDAAAKTIRKLRVKSFRRAELLKDGKDTFDDTVGEFLAKVGEDNILSVHPVQYTHTPKDGAAQVDFGVVVVYKA